MKALSFFNMKDDDAMDIVDSSDEECFFSDSSDNSWIFPMAKPPPEAGYDLSFIELIQETMDKQHQPLSSTQENSVLDYNSIEQGRREQVSIEEVPLLLQDNSEEISLPDFKSSAASDDIQYDDEEDFMQELPPWLCLDNELEMDQFKEHFEKCLEKEPKKRKLSKVDIDFPEDKTSFFFDQIVMTSTPNVARPASKPLVERSESKLPSPAPLKRKLNQNRPVLSKPAIIKSYKESKLPKAIPKRKPQATSSRSNLQKSPVHSVVAKSPQVQAKRYNQDLQQRRSRPTFQPRVPGSFSRLQSDRSSNSDDIFDDDRVEKQRAELFTKAKRTPFVFNLRK